MDLEKIEKLSEMKDKGMITEEEYQKAKAQILNDEKSTASASLDIQNMDGKTYSMMMHFSQFACFIVPVLGWVVPLIMWLTKKDDEFIDQQGRVIANWIISSFIYGVICVMLMFVFIGFFLIFGLIICAVIFTIMGGINAKDGVIRSYPLSIQFLAVNETSRATNIPRE